MVAIDKMKEFLLVEAMNYGEDNIWDRLYGKASQIYRLAYGFIGKDLMVKTYF
jgi:hypothetical protein